MIDWHQQWEQFAPGFIEGCLPLPLNEHALKRIKLSPGPGFGDLSHPTTQLMLEALYPTVKDKHVVDV